MRPLCAQCKVQRTKRRDKTYCSLTCRDAAARKPRQLCAAKCGRRVKRRQQRYCSLACGHLHCRAIRRWCAAKCGHRVKQKKARYCSKSCAWRMRGGLEAAKKGRAQAAQMRRRQYTARLRERLNGMTSVAQVWTLAYKRGYAACHNAWMRKIGRGDVVLVKERTRDWNAA